MLYLAIIYHMHQPYYKNLLIKETEFPWVRLHGIKDYLDMVLMLEKFPAMRLNVNLVPSLIEQIDDYTSGTVRDKFLDLSYKPAADLTDSEKEFIADSFFMINREKVIALLPRYYELYLWRQARKPFTTRDYLDLQVWFNLAWFDPYFRQTIPALRRIVEKGRFYTEEEKRTVLETQIEVMEEILPAYRRIMESKQLETIVSPYYHPILPLLHNTRVQKEANPRSILPREVFSFPEDAAAQVDGGVKLYKDKFGKAPLGMWPSELAVSEHILPLFMKAGVRWIVADEAILYRSMRSSRRDTRLLYQPHLLKREEGSLNIVFRDRNLSDMIGFNYYNWKPEDAVKDLMGHFENINAAFKGADTLVTIAMDGENAWEYFLNDGHDFLERWYEKISESKFMRTVRLGEYLKENPPSHRIRRLAAGSWIYGEFSKWINNPYKNKGWEYLTAARTELQSLVDAGHHVPKQAWKQMYILEGSDWYWWLGEDYPGYFDRLFRMHLSNFYSLIGKSAPEYLKKPIVP
jgi:alpha-amylase/alpha-mannosidase (GH57 family)